MTCLMRARLPERAKRIYGSEIVLFIKLENENAAKELRRKGYDYVKETINGKDFYCFEFTEKLAKIIMSEFADERLIMDEHLHF